MPTVKRFDRCRLEVRSNEHPPPHFHLITHDNQSAAVFLIDTLELWDGEIRPRDAAEALVWAESNRSELHARWRRYNEEEQ